MNILVALALIVAGIVLFLPVVMAWSHHASEQKGTVSKAKIVRFKKAIHPSHA